MKKATTFGACLMLMAAGLAGCGEEQKKGNQGAAESAETATEPAAEPAAKPAAETKAKKDDWTTYQDQDHGFSIEAPRSPRKTAQPTPLADGRNVTSQNFVFSKSTDQGALLVLVTPLAKGDAFDFDAGQNQAVASMGGKVVSHEDIELDGNPGREFHFTAKPQGMSAKGRVKMVLRDNTLYQAMVVYMDGSDEMRAAGERFVDSFAFIDEKDG